MMTYSNSINLSNLLYISLLFIIISCQVDPTPADEKIIYFEPPTDELQLFDKILTPVDSFSFDFGSDTSRFVPGVFMLSVNSKDEIFIVNDHKIVKFTNKGKFISDFGGEGKGPGEFLYLVDLKIDENDNVWFYDIGQKRMTIFEYSDGTYNYERSFEIKNYLNKFCVFDSVIIGYSNSRDTLLTAFDYEGEIVSQGFVTDRSVLRTYLRRFNGGGLCVGFDDQSVYAIFPGDYSIHRFSLELEPLQEIRPKSDQAASFRPEITPFPAQLDPFDDSDQHKKWYYSFDHTGRIWSVEPSYLILEMYREDFDEDPFFYLNIYSEQGKVIAENLPLPVNTRIAGTHKDKIYLASAETLNSDGSIEPVKIYVYRISKKNY